LPIIYAIGHEKKNADLLKQEAFVEAYLQWVADTPE
jgi:hypothetical protein